ncbi:hypothetical protein Barb4_05114 [Bacteroidales bacterium Barb4]|nr:hypothetical protein Barb4_05114 [Bacteroidales bacterium Barb4]
MFDLKLQVRNLSAFFQTLTGSRTRGIEQWQQQSIHIHSTVYPATSAGRTSRFVSILSMTHMFLKLLLKKMPPPLPHLPILRSITAEAILLS